ncbi:hypothetical protein Syun_020954 [Stephania yunnanensis]|uniref:Uncharacterized protein n=1 Tax=Stephania yunnanensis TaxID=152371 RepID=A0AAP0NNQ3_9MAGN
MAAPDPDANQAPQLRLDTSSSRHHRVHLDDGLCSGTRQRCEAAVDVRAVEGDDDGDGFGGGAVERGATGISDLESELLKYWPNIKCPSNEGKYLWRNTWNAYGVCSGLSEHDYFNKALELREKIDLLSIFNKNGIVSTDYADYNLANVKKAIL